MLLSQSPASSSSSSLNRTTQRKSNQYVSAATAGTRALLSQMIAFYVRVPIKLFRPTRVDYLLVPRAINPAVAASLPWKFRTHSSIALLTHAIKEHGWSFIPNQVLPPLIANSAVGMVLYTTYLTALPFFSEHRVQINNMLSSQVPDILTPKQTFLAGFIAGGAQSLAAAPIDAIFTRFSVNELLEHPHAESGELRHKSLWRYAMEKLKTIGLRGVFAGYALSFTKESLGFAFFFSTFESVKQWSYSRIVRDYGAPIPKYLDAAAKLPAGSNQNQHSNIREKPSAALYPATILVAGAAATIALQIVQYPLSRLQNLHLTNLESIDFDKIYSRKPSSEHGADNAEMVKSARTARRELLQAYIKAYRQTFREARALKNMGKHRSWPQWLYKGFIRNTLTAVPSTSVGLFVFEIMRIRYIESVEGVTVELDFAP
ncbi:mitochondrial carrier domain-containing protein [Lipomyces kononenkoae]